MHIVQWVCSFVSGNTDTKEEHTAVIEPNDTSKYTDSPLLPLYVQLADKCK